MSSYEDRLRAVRRYVKVGQRLGLSSCQLVCPTQNALKTGYRDHGPRLAFARRLAAQAAP